jgi:hypothetical protein
MSNVEADRQLMRTAYHEAGHAIAAAVQGIKVEEASIIPTTGTRYSRGALGHCRCAKVGDDRESREKDVIVSLAGPVVDLRQRGLRPNPRWFKRRADPRRGGYDDWHRAYYRTRRIVESLGVPAIPRQTGEYLRWLFFRAQQLIDYDPHWRAVGYLASELYDRKTVGNREVVQALAAGRDRALNAVRGQLETCHGIRNTTSDAFTLDRLLTALDDCTSGRRKSEAVAKELDRERLRWWFSPGGGQDRAEVEYRKQQERRRADDAEKGEG